MLRSGKIYLSFLFFWSYLFLFSTSLQAQFGQFDLFSGRKTVDLPFEYKNGFIIVDVILGGFLPMKFIVDTGAENTILAKREIAEVLRLEFEKEFRIVGSDMTTELIAYVTRRVSIQVANLKSPYNDLLVLDEDYLHFEEFIGEEIYGILGSSFFRHFVVKINFIKEVITLSAKSSYKDPGRKYTEVPVSIRDHRPFIRADIKLHNDTIVNTLLLLDTGASLSLLLHNATHPELELPPNTIKGQVGMGLGGFLEGYLGRVRALTLGGYEFNNVLTNYQDILTLQDTSYLRGRNGVIGNDILSRFIVVIDYPGERLFIRPQRKWDRGFKYDRSGISVIATGVNLNKFSINHIIEGSPADICGLQSGDQIVKVNGVPAGILGLYGITKRFQKKVGKKMRVTVKRNGKKEKYVFRLEELI
jgi:predicted aspartyl protease